MKTETSISGIQSAIASARKAGKYIGFVPTMGNLHAGHLRLVQEAGIRCDFVVVSVFVNPTQFGENEDFDAYPRTLEADCQKLANSRCDIVFAPNVSEMYPQLPMQTHVKVGEVANQLCGLTRAGHFDGVATVVTKLFNIVQPDMAFFGEKDYQQLAVIRQMVADLSFPISITGVPIQRADDGLALSSRNQYLTEDERQNAPLLYKVLTKVTDYLTKGERDYKKLEKAAIKKLTNAGFKVDYIEIKTHNLQLPTDKTTQFVVLGAAKLGDTRLIDNIAFDLT